MALFHPVRTLFFHPIRTITAGAVGAAAAYLFDPEQGTQRRERLNEQIKSQIENVRNGGGADGGMSSASGNTATADSLDPEPVLIPPATSTLTDAGDLS